MSTIALERAALRATLALLRRAIRDAYLPGDDGLEPYQRIVRHALTAIDDLEIALLDLDVVVAANPDTAYPF